MNIILYINAMTLESAMEEAKITRQLLEHIEKNVGGAIWGANLIRITAKCGCVWDISIAEDNIKCALRYEISKCLSVFNHGTSDDIFYTKYKEENMADPNCFAKIKQIIENFDKDYENDWNVLLDIQKQSLRES